MTDIRKIEVLRKELKKYRELYENLKNENKKLSIIIEQLGLADKKEQENQDEQYEKMKLNFDEAVRELSEIKAKYADLIGKMNELKGCFLKKIRR